MTTEVGMFSWFSRRSSAAVDREPVATQWAQHDPVPTPEPLTTRGQLVHYRRATGPSFEPPEKPEKRTPEPPDSQWSPKPLKRHLRPETAATQFVQWLLSEGYSGEYRWIDLWRMYRLDYCRQVNEQPVAPNYQNLFAQQLGHLCRRDYYREIINGKRRFYRTYHIQPLQDEIVRVGAA